MGLGQTNDWSHGWVDTAYLPAAIRFTSVPPVAQVFTNGENTFFITREGEVYGWGLNRAGSLGRGVPGALYSPVILPLWQGARSFHFSKQERSVTVAVMADGTVRASGTSSLGFFGGTNNVTSSLVPISVPSLQSISGNVELSDCGCALDNRGRVFEWGYKARYNNPTGSRTIAAVMEVPVSQPAIEVTVSGASAIVLMADGTSASWGGETVAGALGRDPASGIVSSAIKLPLLADAMMVCGGGWGATGCCSFSDGTSAVFGEVEESSGVWVPLPALPGIEETIATTSSTLARLANGSIRRLPHSEALGYRFGNSAPSNLAG
jgi:hypothetical protein